MARHLLKPNPIKPGDTIGIVAPASPFDPDAFEAGRAVLHDMGFTTKMANGLFERQGFLAGKDAHRLTQLHTMLVDDTVQAIICARGGYGTLRILSQLDFGQCGDNAKPFIGFSDITALHLTLQQQADWVTFHGPMVTSLARCDDASRQSFFLTMTGQHAGGFDLTGSRCLHEGTAQGRLVGGNLATLCHLVGTPYAGQFNGTILLLEDTGEAPYRIDRMLTQMALAGAFKGLAGVVLGTFDKCGKPETIDEIMRAHFSPLGIPVVAGAAVGHGVCNLTLPLGIQVQLDTDPATLIYQEHAFDGSSI